jgi:hypothetical protein
MKNNFETCREAMERFYPKSSSNMPQIIDLDKLPRDPSKRKRITDFHPNQQEEITIKYLTWGQPFRGHDESKNWTNKGNYLELKDYTMVQNDVVAKAFKNAPLNNQMVSPTIQKDITECFADTSGDGASSPGP